MKRKCLEHRQPFVETNKQSAAAWENWTPRDRDVTKERNQAAGAATIWFRKLGRCCRHCQKKNLVQQFLFLIKLDYALCAGL